MADYTGTAGPDTYTGTPDNDTISGLEGDDILNGADGDDLIDGGADNDTLRGQGGADHLIGGAGNDTLIGAFTTGFGAQPGDLADHLEGGTGNDVLRGGDGDDWLEGGDDNDNLRGDAGSDTMDGGAGEDFVSYFYIAVGFGISFDARNFGATSSFSVADPLGGTDIVSNVERIGIGGTNFDDFLQGSLYFTASGGFYANQMSGNGGNDVIYGGPSNDFMDGGDGDDLMRGFGGDDALIGGNGSDYFSGGAGVDTFDGGSEDPLSTTFGDNSFGDRISFFETTATQGVVADLRTGIISNDGFGNVETMTGIEGLGGDTAYVDTFHGNSLRNLLLGSKGDFLYGYEEEDFFQLAGAPAIVDGGTGTDWLNLVTFGYLLPDSTGDGVAENSGAMAAGWQVDLAAGTIVDGFGDTGSVTGIENVVGTELDDRLFGDSAANRLEGGAGSDVLSGLAGNDTLLGGAGDDYLMPGFGINTLDGGDGLDRAFFYISAGSPPLYITYGTGAESSKILVMQSGATPLRVAEVTQSGDSYTVTGVGSFSFLGTNTLTNIERIAFSPAPPPGELTPATGFSVLVLGTGGNDNLEGNVGNDLINAGFSDDLANGLDGDDLIRGEGGGDHLIGGAGNDILVGGYSTSFFPQSGDFGDHLEGGTGNDLLRGGDGDDWLEGGDDNDNLRGDAGSDTLDGGAGIDFVSFAFVSLGFGIGFDARNFGATATFNVADPLGGTDTVSNVELLGVTGTTFDDFIRGSLYFTASPGFFANQLYGDGGNDTIFGGPSNDLINGGAGDDNIRGEAGDDVLNGGDGSDLIRSGAGVDTIDGGSEDPLSTTFGPNSFGDRLSFFEVTATQGVVADLRTGVISNDGFGNVETMTGIEGLGGDTAFADTFHGNSGRNVLLGSKGDFLYGHEEEDFIQLSGAAAVTDGGSGTDWLTLATFGYLLPDSTGDGVAENSGVMTAGWIVDMPFNYIADGFGNSGTILNVENVTGTELNDIIFGDAQANVISGGAGDDLLRGNEGNDTLSGGDGSDHMRGGAGVDSFDGGAEDPLSTTFGPNSFGDRISFFEVTATQGVIADLRTGVISNDGFGNVEAMTGIEGLGGDTAFVDTFHGNDSRNTLLGSKGDFLYGYGEEDFFQLGGAAAVVDGGTGTDWLNLTTSGYLLPDSNGDGVAENGPAMTAGWFVNLAASSIVDGFGNSGFITGIENVVGTELNDTLFGNGQANRLEGGAGGDNLRGNGGDDTLIGGDGNDLMRGGTGVDSFDGGAHTLVRDGTQPGAYGDRVSFSEIGATQGVVADLRTGIISNDGFGNAETMTGIESLGADTAFADTLHGDDYSNFIWGALGDFLYGHGDDDYMQISGAAALVDGGDGVDTLTLLNGGYLTPDANADGNAETAPFMTNGWVVSLEGNGGIDGFGNGLTVVNIENLVGTALNDTLIGDGAANRLEGGDGNDNMRGRGGSDHLIGGNGNDTLGGGYDTSFGPQPGDGADHLEGGAGNDVLRGGDGDDILEGGADNDNLRGDAGSDTMDGGDGVDFVSYFFTALGSGITFDARGFGATSTFTVADPLGGTDTLSNIETIGIGGTNFDDVIYGSELLAGNADGFVNQLGGNAGNDTIYGSARRDSLDGGADNDLLLAGAGDDTLTGGAGNDDLDGGTGEDIAYFFLDAGAVGILSVVAGTGADAGKQLVMLTDGATSTRVAEITTSGAVVTVTGVNAGAGFGTDTVTNVQQLIFAGSDPTGPAALTVDVAAVTGIVSDGYLAGATIFIDENGNGLLDPGEVSTLTDANGNFTVPELGSGNLIAIGGVSTDTGLANELVLTAPNGATVVNPLTTLVQAIVEQDGVDPAVAEAQVLAALGLDSDLDLLGTDLIAAAAGGDADALDAQKAAAIVVAILTAAEDAAGGAAGAEEAAIDALARLIADGSVDLTDSAVIEQVLEAAAPDAGDLGAIADQVAETADAIDEAETLDEIADSQAAALLTGNDLDNILTGGNQGDVMSGLGGDDELTGGNGVDRLSGGTGKDLFIHQINSDKVASKTGPIALDLILDFQHGQDRIDLSGIDANSGLAGDQAFRLIGDGSSELAGDLWVRTFGTMNAAESALGIEIDGVAGASPFTGKVSVLFGNVDGGAPDFALVLIGAPTITVSDLIL